MSVVYLKKKSDTRPIIPMEELWISTEALLKRDDMEEYVPGKVSIQPPKPAEMEMLPPAVNLGTDSDIPPPPSVTLASGDDDDAPVDLNQIAMIKQVIRVLDKDRDFTKKTPQRESMPRVEAIERELGRKLLPGEREAAWEEVKAEMAPV